MGWASASDIFDPIAEALIELDAAPEIKRRVLGPLISKLRNGDWDTWEESLNEFGDDPVIVSIFYERTGGRELYNDGAEGVLDYEESSNEWVMRCEACGELGRGDGESAVAHNDLVALWAKHDQDKHDGDGQVPAYMLIDAEVGTAAAQREAGDSDRI